MTIRGNVQLRRSSSVAEPYELATRSRVLVGRPPRPKPMAVSGTDCTLLPAGLSTREAEVLRCVAEGLSNCEKIGLRLFISQNTVANHVRTILRKTGCSNRTEATSYAHRTGCRRTLLSVLSGSSAEHMSSWT